MTSIPETVPGALTPLRAADNLSVSVEERARGVLHSNCAMCHREGSGSGAATMDLRIASIALSQGLTLLTRDLRDFSKVPRLVMEDWTV